ncbi:MAG TPA: CoA pyrophosphatase [Microthrixaceae bacterium]|nr:CoA pyrophosphatase [Microthrixaceae bacterium]
MDLDDIAQRLTQMSIDRAMSMVAQSRQRSAVAVVLSQGRRGPELLLTRRAWHMRTHRGEIAFPGGGEEDGDVFPVGTALREACEEVALDPGSVEPIAALDPMVTFTSDKAVVPIVFETDQRPSVVASPDEVDAILQVSFADLLEEGCYRQELWTWSDSTLRDAPEAGYQHPVHFFELYGDTLWGATASMINQLLTVVFAPEAFEELMRGPEHFGR